MSPPHATPEWRTLTFLDHSGSDERPFVVFADDHLAIADALTRMLSDEFQMLPPIGNLSLLHRVAMTIEPAVLIVDLDFEGTPAFSTITGVAHSCVQVQAIAFSGRTGEYEVKLAIEAGALDYVSKLDDQEALRDAVRRAVRRVQVPRGCPPSIGRRSRVAPRRKQQHCDLTTWLLRSGFKQKAIAEAMGLALRTVEHHSTRLRRGRVHHN